MKKTCETLRTDLSAYLDGELGEEDVRRIEAHLEGCTECGRVLEQWRRVGSALAALCAVPSAAKSLPAQVLARVRREEPAERSAAPWFALPALRWAAVLAAVVCGVVAAWMALPTGPGRGIDVAGEVGPPEAIPEMPAAAAPLTAADPVAPSRGSPVLGASEDFGEAAKLAEPALRHDMRLDRSSLDIKADEAMGEADRLFGERAVLSEAAEGLESALAARGLGLREERDEDSPVFGAQETIAAAGAAEAESRERLVFAVTDRLVPLPEAVRPPDTLDPSREPRAEGEGGVADLPFVAGPGGRASSASAPAAGEESGRVRGKGGFVPAAVRDDDRAAGASAGAGPLAQQSVLTQEQREAGALQREAGAVQREAGMYEMMTQPPAGRSAEIAMARQAAPGNGRADTLEVPRAGDLVREVDRVDNGTRARVGRLRFVAIDADWAVNYTEAVARELDGDIIPPRADVCPSRADTALQVVLPADNVERFVQVLEVNNVRVVDWETPEDPVIEDLRADGLFPASAMPDAEALAAAAARVDQPASAGAPVGGRGTTRVLAKNGAAEGGSGEDDAGGELFAGRAPALDGFQTGYFHYGLKSGALRTYCVEIEGVADPVRGVGSAY